MSGVVDNATDLVAVEGINCGSCNGSVYDISGNVDLGKATIDSDIVVERYGQNLLKGNYAKDDFCFQLGKCVSLEFLYIEEQDFFDADVDAILGFARPDKKFLLSPGAVKRPNLSTMFLSALSDYGEEPFFSTRFQRDFISWIDIGTPDLKQNKTESIYIDVFDDFFWSTTLQGVRYGTRRDKAFTFGQMDEGTQIEDGIYSIFDTGAPDIYLSILWYESFVEQLYAEMSIDYDIQDGTAKAACATNYPDLYFMLNGYWLQVKPKDYIREESATICSLKIKPIDAPFNIMGMPAYIGYYIQHNWEQGYMGFAPHTDSSNSPLTEASTLPTQELKVKYATQNTPNGDVWAFAISFFICLCAVGFYGYAIYYTWSMGETFTSDAEAVGYAAGGFFVIFISFFILQWFLLLFLMPGNNVVDVPSNDEAIRQVNATHMGLIGFLSYFFYKLCGKKKEMQQKQAASTAPESTSAADIDELINTIE